MPITQGHLAQARYVVRTISHTLKDQLGLAPVFKEHVVTEAASGVIYLFTALDTRRLEGKLAPYMRQDTLHQIQTNLNGLPVGMSNTSGLRYGVPLSKAAPLPKLVEFAKPKIGELHMGVGTNRKAVSASWDALGHILVAGQTGSGKSTFLRLLTFQAVADSQRLLIGDRHRTTVPMLAGHPNVEKIGKSTQDYTEIIERGRAICAERERLFAACPEFPEKIGEYNAWAARHGKEVLPRIMIILEEYNATLVDLGGPNGKFGQATKALIMEGRKFGVTVVIASQEFEKKALGPLRSQIGTFVVFYTEDKATARNIGLRTAERIPPGRPGLAATNRWGLVQTYYLPKQRLIALGGGERINLLTDEQRAWVQRALKETDGRMTIPLLQEWGLGHRAARKLLADWEMRGWLKRDLSRGNARFITEKLMSLL